MANTTRIPGPLKVALVLLPVVGAVAWFFYDSGAEPPGERRGKVQPKHTINSDNVGELTVVVSADGQPLAEVGVVAFTASTSNRVRVQRTDDRGHALFTSVPPGKTIVGVRHMGFERAKRTITVKAKSEHKVEIELERRNTDSKPEPAPSADDPEDDQRVVSGRVENTRGEPIYQAKVGLSTGALPKYAESDMDGKFVFRGVPAKQVELFVSADGHLTTTLEKVRVGSTDVVVVMPEEASVSGRLEIARPIKDLVVRLCRYEKVYQRDRCLRTRRYQGSPERFELQKVPAGKYDLVFFDGKKELKRVPVEVDTGRTVEVPPQTL